MSDNNQAQQEGVQFEANIGEWSGTFRQEQLRAKRKGKDGREIPAVITVRPVFKDTAHALAFLAALTTAADVTRPNGGVDLVQRYVFDEIDDSYKAVAKDDGSFDDEELFAQYANPDGGTHRKSLASIDSQQAECNAELAKLSRFMLPPGASAEIVARTQEELNEAGLTPEGLAQRCMQLYGKLETLAKLRIDAEKAAAEAREKRKKNKADKAKAVVAEPTPEPAN